MAFDPIELRGTHVHLLPLSQDHCADLAQAVRDGELWNLWYTRIPTPDGMAAEIDSRLKRQAAGEILPFAVIEPRSGKAVGMTTYLDIDHISPRAEIGSTWYARSVQRSPLNTEAKLMLLTHAFDTLGCLAIELRTHFLNHQSRRAIERLGARLDGVLRQHSRMANGTLRDTAVYSILDSEWPAVRAGLEWKLAQPRYSVSGLT